MCTAQLLFGASPETGRGHATSNLLKHWQSATVLMGRPGSRSAASTHAVLHAAQCQPRNAGLVSAILTIYIMVCPLKQKDGCKDRNLGQKTQSGRGACELQKICSVEACPTCTTIVCKCRVRLKNMPFIYQFFPSFRAHQGGRSDVL